MARSACSGAMVKPYTTGMASASYSFFNMSAEWRARLISPSPMTPDACTAIYTVSPSVVWSAHYHVGVGQAVGFFVGDLSAVGGLLFQSVEGFCSVGRLNVVVCRPECPRSSVRVSSPPFDATLWASSLQERILSNRSHCSLDFSYSGQHRQSAGQLRQSAARSLP